MGRNVRDGSQSWDLEVKAGWWCGEDSLLPFHQAFNRGKREGFFLKSVENAPLAKRRKQKLRSAATSRRVSPVPAAPGRAPATKGAPRRANGPLPPS